MEKKIIKNPRTLNITVQGNKVKIKLKDYLKVETIDNEIIEGVFTKILQPLNKDDEPVIYILTKEYETSVGVSWIKSLNKIVAE